MEKDEKFVQSLGWFSVGLGLVEVLAPRSLGKWLGLEDRAGLLRAYGFREITTGIGLLSQRGPAKPAGWVWARVGGDALDIATLSAAITPDNPKRANAEIALGAVAAITLVDVACAQHLSRLQRERAGEGADPTIVERSLTIGRSADELYRLWGAPQTLPRIMEPFADVAPANGRGTHWKLRMPLGQNVEWDTRIVEDIPGQLVRWHSADEADMSNEGSVRFHAAPGDRGTEVTLRFHFDPPGGAIGEALTKLLGVVPDMAAGKALRRFKALAETGEIPTTRPQPAARADKD